MATKAGRGPRRPPPSPVPWVIGAVVVVVAAGVWMFSRGPVAPSHPEPRADATNLAESIMPASFFTTNPRVVRTYQLARTVPATLDGIYCYCHCRETEGHKSLLTCFQSAHGASCEVCLGEADMAAEMHAQGRSLAEIRAQIDLSYGR